MKKLLIIFLLFQTPVCSQNLVNIYLAGGCFWCMEESFEKTDGILDVISGYSGGTTDNPTYKEVTYGKTGHFETVKITYDSEVINYKKVLDVYWKNVDPFDSQGQFCDKGYSYRSVIFYKNANQKKIIDQSIKNVWRHRLRFGHRTCRRLHAHPRSDPSCYRSWCGLSILGLFVPSFQF